MDARRCLAVNIRKLRVRRGLSQEAFADHAGIDRTYVSRIERGLQNPSLSIIEKLARALDVKLSELFVAPKAGENKPAPLAAGRKKGARY